MNDVRTNHHVFVEGARRRTAALALSECSYVSSHAKLVAIVWEISSVALARCVAEPFIVDYLGQCLIHYYTNTDPNKHWLVGCSLYKHQIASDSVLYASGDFFTAVNQHALLEYQHSAQFRFNIEILFLVRRPEPRCATD